MSQHQALLGVRRFIAALARGGLTPLVRVLVPTKFKLTSLLNS
jgi:hypothetical protein